MMTVLAAMLAVTSCFADQQADYIKQIRDNPTADFSQTVSQDDSAYYDVVTALASADAMVYFQDHKEIKALDLYDALTKAVHIGEAHAFKHHLIGKWADVYAGIFDSVIRTLITTD
jgi:hypothetical protein